MSIWQLMLGLVDGEGSGINGEGYIKVDEYGELIDPIEVMGAFDPADEPETENMIRPLNERDRSQLSSLRWYRR